MQKIPSLIMAAVLTGAFCCAPAFASSETDGALGVSIETAAADTTTADYSAKLTFSDTGIAETVKGSGYTINGTTLTITQSGTYVLSGSCSEGSIEVAKGLSDVTLELDGLSLASSSTAPIVVKKGSAAEIHLVDGTSSTLIDNENPANETSSDTTVAEAFEGACVKVKSGGSVTFCGGGNLTCVANAKNGIKGGSTAALTFNQTGTIRVSGSYSGYATSAGAVNNGIASDGSIVFNQGTFDIDAANDGIKSAPDATDETAGTTVDTESAGTITINGGTFDIDVNGDGIQADTALTINNGDFNIKTMNGYSTSGTKYKTNGNTNASYTFDPDTMSCKGLKASGDRAEEVGTSPTLTITGGNFALDTADDAIHSDAYAVVTGGSFAISSGDDGMHADTSLILGTEGSGLERDPDVTISYSYEGLEGGTVYMYSGRFYVMASDDGVNAAGGSDSSGSEPGGGGFNPGGGGPGGGLGGGMFPHSVSTQATSDYNIYIQGGELYVNCSGDGLDSNGGLYLTGGMQQVYSQSSGDNSAIDADGTISIAGATIFTAGANPAMDPVQSSWFGSGQKYATRSGSVSANTTVNATVNGSVAFSTSLPKACAYLMYSAPASSSVSLSTGGSVSACKAGSWSHSWGSGSTSNGVTTYTCSKCGAIERQTVAATVTVDACDHSVEISDEAQVDEGYAVTFAGDAGVESIDVYYTQYYTSASESVTATGSAVSRNSTSGEPDSTGDGQLNFTVKLKDGYSISSVTATEGTYKNIKGPSDTGVANTYRITKISGATTVSITTASSETNADANDVNDETGTGTGGDNGESSGSGSSSSGSDSGSGNSDTNAGSNSGTDADTSSSSSASDNSSTSSGTGSSASSNSGTNASSGASTSASAGSSSNSNTSSSSNASLDVNSSSSSNISPDASPSVGTKNMYRLYNPNSGEHFYTSDNLERARLINAGWSDEGLAWTAPETSATPVFRLYNEAGGEHHYTIDASERDALIDAGWNNEGIGWYSDDAHGTALYREYNPNAFANNHNYTSDVSEHEWLLSLGWNEEGVGWYGV